MALVNVADVMPGLAAAQRLYSIGFTQVNNAGPKYRDFGEDIRLLAINLDLTYYVVQRAQNHAAAFNTSMVQVQMQEHQVLGNLRETLSDCERLLDDPRFFTKCDGVVSDVFFYYQIDDEVQKLRDRIAHHNIKLSIALKILDFEILGDRFIQIYDPTDRILSALGQLGRQTRGEEYDHLPPDPPAPVVIPQELEDGFFTLAREIFPNLAAVPLDQGVDVVAFYFNRTTKTPDQLVQREIKYLINILNIMMAIWLLRLVRAGQDYQNVTRYCSPDPVGQQMDLWGMTVERFFDKFEEILHEAFRNLLGRHLLPPPIPDLLEIFEKERRIWQGNPVNTPMQEAEPTELGTKIMSASLRCPDPSYAQTLHVYRQTEKRFSLLLVKTAISEGRDKETIDGYDLESVQIIPSYAVRTLTSPPLDPQTIRFRTDSHSPLYRNLTFHQTKDMFEFQQVISGYKVVHDEVRVLVTSQESKFLGGSRRQDLCRLQIWTAKVDATLATQTSFSSVTPMSSRRRSSVFTLSTISSGLRKSANSTSSSSSIITDLPTQANFGVPVGGAAVYAAPVLPCIVLFAHKIPERGEEEGISRSYLIIDIKPEVNAEEELIESEYRAAPSYRCVIESKGSHLSARRSPETNNPDMWDLAVAGLHKRQAGTGTVKRLKHIIIQFDTQNSLSQFATKFKQVQDLAKLRLSQFLQATDQ